MGMVMADDRGHACKAGKDHENAQKHGKRFFEMRVLHKILFNSYQDFCIGSGRCERVTPCGRMYRSAFAIRVYECFSFRHS